MAWIESHQGLGSHPKTKRMMRKLNISAPLAVGHLHLLWWWALDFAQDGEITNYDSFDISDACQWAGCPNELLDALIEAKFIDVVNDRKYLHDWHIYAGKLIEIRNKDKERKRNSREKKHVSSGIPMDIQRTSIGIPTESIRDLDLNPFTTTTESDETVMDIHLKVFKTFSISGLIQDYFGKLRTKGFTDTFIKELMLETGESGTNPSLRLMETIGDRWERDGIYTRAEAKRRKQEAAQQQNKSNGQAPYKNRSEREAETQQRLADERKKQEKITYLPEWVKEVAAAGE